MALHSSRNHIPEVKGHFVEEWHQKLHNNTTPDDVPICEAYIAFMEVRAVTHCIHGGAGSDATGLSTVMSAAASCLLQSVQ